MKNILLLKKTLLFVLFFCSSVMTIKAQSSANVNDVMLQSFGWDVHTQPSIVAEGGLYNYLNNRAAGYAAAGFNLIWLPPPSKSTGGVGYIPTELFNFTQTSYGSEAQLRTLLTTLNTSSPKIHPMADIVVNHRGGSTNWTDFTNPTWDCSSITNNDEANFVTITGVRPCGTADTGEDFNGARDLDHTNIQVQTGVKEYLTRLKALGFDSWRWDVAKGFSASYFGDYISSSAPYASVGEYWDGNINNLKTWIDGAGKKSAAFDFALYYNTLQPAFNNGNYSVLAGNPGLAGQFGYADKSVTFVDNHDTFVKAGSFTSNDNIMKAYAYILTHPGIPCVFFPHYHGGTYKKDGVTVVYTANETAINSILAVRKANGINAYSSVVVSNSSTFYSATIDNKVTVKIGPGLWNPGTGWVLKASGTDYAIWDKGNVVDVPSLTISQPGGTFTTGTTVNVVLTANNATSTIYYTTDGTVPTTTSASAIGTKTLAITANTTLKAFVKNTANVSSSVYTETYTFGTPPTFTVYFKKPTNWNAAVKVYYWTPTGTAPVITWPGVAMTQDCGDWYKYTFPSTVSATNLLFNDGTLKTADLTATAGIKYYDNAWLSAEPVDRCPIIAPDFTISQAGGTFTTGSTITTVLTANVNTSTIYYTVDGTTPSTTSPSAVGTKTITITANTTLKAFVKNTTGISSAVKTEVYNFTTPTTFTVYFKKPTNWNAAVKVYYWAPTGTAPVVAWPGVAMTQDCGDWYKYTFPSTVSATNLIFNDGTLKTADLTATAGIKYYDNAWLATEPTNRCPIIAPDLTIVSAGGTFTAGTTVNVVLTANVNTSTIYYTLDGTTPTTSSPSAVGAKTLSITANTTVKALVINTVGTSSAVKTEVYTFVTVPTLTVYFKPPTTWTGVPKVHYWNAVPAGSVANTTWPGIAMVADVNGFYKYTITGPTSINLIFNNGSSGTANQTADLLNKTNGYSYTWGASTAKLSLAKETLTETTSISIFPNPVSSQLQVSSSSAVLDYQILSINGIMIQAGKAVNNTIDMSNLNNGLYFIQIRFENGQEYKQKIIKK
ncbi:starch-binding protein [Flavobacterium sp. IMCC34518]|uniref:starch-binding protein n=1 Tax=Flavobacterium sp. IMCC34518 TaxID=3003623 RepID=UPI0022AC2494|nr:starch-binding protein [Flavobacterium sp. IMCC34518]